MNANISMGAPAPNPLQALARLLPTGKPATAIPLPYSRKRTSRQTVQLVSTDTGITAYANGSPVAWIVPGYHQGQADNNPLRCDFVDVAYHRKTPSGINLETADFLTLDAAVAFVSGIFGGAV